MKDEVLEAYGRQQLDDVQYWVYVLECHERFYVDGYDDLARRAESRLGYEPNWLRHAWEADSTVYVGQTENLEKRLGQHFKNYHSSEFTELYEPTEINYLHTCWSRNQAERREEKIAKSYYDNESVYAYWN
jgi:predicted GIY-YIG superfamily endonuclease